MGSIPDKEADNAIWYRSCVHQDKHDNTHVHEHSTHRHTGTQTHRHTDAD